MDNNLSKQQLEISSVTSKISRLKEIIDNYNKSIDQMNNQISKSESEIVKNNALIERKQTQIDQLNKKIDSHISKLDGVRNYEPGVSGNKDTYTIYPLKVLAVCCIRVYFTMYRERSLVPWRQKYRGFKSRYLRVLKSATQCSNIG